MAYRTGLFGFAFKGCNRVWTDTGPFSRLLKLRKAVLMQVVHSNGGKKFMRKIEVLKVGKVPGKQQPLLTFAVSIDCGVKDVVYDWVTLLFRD